METHREIWTIGHSTHTFEVFADLLQRFGIEVVADVRFTPGSARQPHFTRQRFQSLLAERGIGYVHIKDLGGKRKALEDSPNTGWKTAGFRGYADHMATPSFEAGVTALLALAEEKRVACVCAEAMWWRCHRSLLSDYLKWKEWDVVHILKNGSGAPHCYTFPAKLVNGRLGYPDGSIVFPE